jgi:glycosyltransferase involved in cell wall biosynthesis
LLRKVNVVCANGDALAQVRGFLGSHAVELPIGIHTCRFKPGPSAVRHQLGWTGRNRVIGYVGRLMHLKGVDILAAAFRQFCREDPDARLLIVGSGPEEANIRPALAAELSLGVAHIEPDVGHTALADWYRAMDVLVMPSRYENFSNALLEGMACGVPFVASDVGGNRMLAATGAGLLFEAGSESSLAAKLKTILSNPSALRERASAGAMYVRNSYDWKRTAECLEQIFATRLGVRL